MESLTANSDVRPRTNAAPVTPREPIFTKGEKTCPDSGPTRVQNFTPLAFSANEKPVTVKTKKKNKNSKLSIAPYYRMVGV